MKIMIVDDEIKLRNTLKKIIVNKIGVDIEIIEAEDGKEALDLMQKECVDILLTDIIMPNMNGFELIKKIKKSREMKNIFIAAITGLGGDDQIKKIYDVGADFYIAKPFLVDDIIARLRFIMQFVEKDKYQAEIQQKKVINLFDDHCLYNCKITFSMENQSDIFLLWKQFSQEDLISASYILKDIIVEFDKIYRKLSYSNSKPKFKITLEYSKDFAYLTTEDEFCTNVAKEIVKSSEYKDVKYKDNVFTIRIGLTKPEEESNSIVDNSDGFIEFDEIESDDISFTRSYISIDEFLEDSNIDEFGIIDELNDLEDDFLELKNSMDISDRYKQKTEQIIECYIKVFAELMEFVEVKDILYDFLKLIEEIDSKNISQENLEILKELVESVVEDLFKWKNEVFIKKEALNVHYMDDSLISNITQLREMFNMMKSL